MLRVIQVSRTAGQACGIAYFAAALDEQLRASAIPSRLVSDLSPPVGADVVIVHHHWDLFEDEEIRRFCRSAGAPVVLFAHEPGIERFTEAAGFVTLAPSSVTTPPPVTFAHVHPAWAPPRLSDRDVLKERFGLPPGFVLGSSGFLRFERAFPAILTHLLPVAQREGWFVDLLTSPWRDPSPGLIDELDRFVEHFPRTFRFTNRYLRTVELNERLQACDLIWSWTSNPSRAYASGALADQYASGTRVFACAKKQYAPILALPNAVSGPAALPAFCAALIAEARRLAATPTGVPRHDPSILAWDRFVRQLVSFLQTVNSASSH